MRISGTLSSLAGLEDAIEKEDDDLIERAVGRIKLLRSIQISIGGVPLLYIGDEWGMLNDYKYLTDPLKVNDSRWVYPSRKRWQAREDLTDQDTLAWRFFHEMVKLIDLRKKLPALQNGGMEVIHTGNPRLYRMVFFIHSEEESCPLPLGLGAALLYKHRQNKLCKCHCR